MQKEVKLKWNEFRSSVSKSFEVFRHEDYLQDVTLVTDDHCKVSAHKLVLSAASEYFKSLFMTIGPQNSNTVICLDGVTSNDLKKVLDYMYKGEVEVYQDGLDTFLALAQRIHLNGLLVNEDYGRSDKENRTLVENENINDKNSIEIIDETISKDILHQNSISDANERVDDFIEKIISEMNVQYKCTLCDKVANMKHHIQYHIETHLNGIAYSCTKCEKVCPSRNALYAHKARYHPSQRSKLKTENAPMM